MPALDEEKAARTAASGAVGKPRRHTVTARALVSPRTAGALAEDLPGDLPFVGARVLARRCDEVPRRWLVQDVLAEFSYGTVAAQYKAGKTWVAIDLGVSVATGTKWLNTWPCGRGTVVMFYGEGDEHEAVQRMRAVCESRGIEEPPDSLILCCEPPNLGHEETLNEIGKFLIETQPVLVIVDPLYLAQSGTSGRNLAEMGQFLRKVQMVCKAAGASLIVMAHWNKTGGGDGMDRITGTGLQEWSRLMINLSIAEEAEDDPDDKTGTSRVMLKMELGGTRARGLFAVRRKVWSDDRHNLDSPMHYRTSVFVGAPPEDERKNGHKSRKQTGSDYFMAALDEVGPKASAQAMAKQLGWSPRTVNRYASDLTAAGRLTVSGDPDHPQRRLYSRPGPGQ